MIPAGAQLAHAADIDTSLGGFVKLQYGLTGASGQRGGGQGALLDGETHLEILGQTDTGVLYGARLQLLRAAKPGDNGTYIKAGWAWGEFRLGDYGGAAKELSVSAPTIGVGQIDGALDRFGGPSALIAPYGLNKDDSTKLTYLSPSILGIRLGLSYTPELSGGGVEPVPARPVNGIDAHRNVVEIALGAARDMGDVSLTAGAAYVAGDARSGSRLHDLSGGAVGARVAWNGFTAGGGFVYDGANSLPPDRRPGHAFLDSVISEVNMGIAYQFARWNFGVSWAHDDRKALPSNDIIAAGLSYRLVEGLTLGVDLLHYTAPAEERAGSQNAVIAETALHF
jgi:hypothetical protein